MLEPLTNTVLSSIPNYSDSYTVGLSGGIDSVVLLHILIQIRNSHNLNISAIHVNHGISANAFMWQNFCQNFCDENNVQLTIIEGIVNKNGGESLENNARNFRYNAFQNFLSTTIVLAHHKNDQIETMLSQLFRGSDLHNIASMKILTQKKSTTFWRPLLNIAKADIIAYATKFNLTYINDESNFDKKYLRNFIRHEILPDLIQWDNNIEPKLLNVIKQIQNSLDLIDEVARSDLLSVIDKLNSKLILVDKLSLLSEKRQINTLSYYIQQANLPLPTNKQITEFNRQALQSTWDSMPTLMINESFQIIKSKDKIYLISKS